MISLSENFIYSSSHLELSSQNLDDIYNAHW